MAIGRVAFIAALVVGLGTAISPIPDWPQNTLVVNGWLQLHSCNANANPEVRGDNLLLYSPLSNSPLTSADNLYTSLRAVFTRGIANDLLGKYQLNTRGAWGDWNSFGSPSNTGLHSDPVAIGNGKNLIQVFAIGADGNLYSVLQSATNGTQFSSWQLVGSSLANATGATRNPTVVIDKYGQLNAFLVVNDVAYYTHETGAASNTWTAWKVMAGNGKLDANHGQIAVALNTYTGLLEAYGILSDGKLYHAWQLFSDRSFHSWYHLAGIGETTYSSSPSVRSMKGSIFNGMLEVFARGTDNKVHHVWQQTCDGVDNPWGQCTWSPYYTIGDEVPVNVTSPVTFQVTTNIHGGLELFVTGNDGALWHLWQTAMWGKWSNWESLGSPPDGALTSAPTLVKDETGWWVAYARGHAGDLEIYVQDKKLQAVPVAVPFGQNISVLWSVPVDEASSSDWLGIFLPGANNSQFLDFLYVNGQQNDDSHAYPTGTVQFQMAYPEGIYEIRYLVNGSPLDVLRVLVKVTNDTTMNPTEQVFAGMTIGLGTYAFDFQNCVQDWKTTYQEFNSAFTAFADRQVYAGLNELGLAVEDFGNAMVTCSQTDIAQAIIKFAKDIIACTEDDCEALVVDLVNELIIVSYERRHEIFGDIQAATNNWAIGAFEEAGIDIGRVIRACIAPPA